MDLILLEDGSQRSSGELHRTLPKIRIRKLAVATAMVVAARLLSQPLYSGTERLISTAVKAFTGRRLRSATKEGFTDMNTSLEKKITIAHFLRKKRPFWNV